MTYYFYLSGCDNSPDPDHCIETQTPIQASIDDVKTNGMPTDGTIYLEEGDFEESFVIDGFTSALTICSVQFLDSTKPGTQLLGDIEVKNSSAAIVLKKFDFLGLIKVQNVPNLTVIGTDGADLIKVQLLGNQNIGVTLNGGEGSDQYAVSMEGTGGTQTVNINDTGVNDDNGDGTFEDEIDQVMVSGTTGNDTFIVSTEVIMVDEAPLNQNTIQSGSQTVTSSTLEKWLVDGNEGNDTLQASTASSAVLTEFEVNDRNTGHLTGPTTTFVTSFTNIQNLVGGAYDDTFTIMEFGTLSGKIMGGGGTDTLYGPSYLATDEPGMGYIWEITGSYSGSLIDAETGLVMILFEQIEELLGGDYVTDSIHVAIAGLMDLLDGGDSGQDSLLIERNGLDGVILTGAGTFSTNDTTGRMFNYAGMDDIVVSNEAGDGITVFGTNLDDIIEVSTEFLNKLVVGFQNYLIDQGGGLVATLSYTLPSTALAFVLLTGNDQIKFNTLERLTGLSVTVDGGPGNDTLIGPDTNNQWDVNGPGEGLLNDIVAFLGIENLEGGAGEDHATGPPYIPASIDPPTAELNTYLWVINADNAGILVQPLHQ